MKVMTILGTRPEIIRLSRIVEKLDGACQHVLVNTGQNFDFELNDVFFAQLGIRPPNYSLGVRGETFGEQVGRILAECEQVLIKERPDKLLILGDTNSALSAFIAKRLGIPVYHLEAGNRCYDDRVPEEVNRRVIDHSSDILLPYTERSRANLLREGIEGRRIFVVGNPILEVIEHYKAAIQRSAILKRLDLTAGRYFLVTMHREENVDDESRLRALLEALQRLQAEYRLPVICSLHPRTRNRMQSHQMASENDQIQFHRPFGLFDFIALERNAACVLSDSGTVQEECCIFKIPNVTIRDVTERPETIECGSNVLSGVDPETILACVRALMGRKSEWTPPPEYLFNPVSTTVVKIVLGRSPAA